MLTTNKCIQPKTRYDGSIYRCHNAELMISI